MVQRKHVQKDALLVSQGQSTRKNNGPAYGWGSMTSHANIKETATKTEREK